MRTAGFRLRLAFPASPVSEFLDTLNSISEPPGLVSLSSSIVAPYQRKKCPWMLHSNFLFCLPSKRF